MSLFGEHWPYTNLHELNLNWLLEISKKLAEEVDTLDEFTQKLQNEINQLGDDIDEKVKQWLLEQGPAVAQQWIAQWIKQSVAFGLTDSGYWCAWIPESWKTIQFETTGLDVSIPIQPEYGHLVLAY